MGTKLIAFHLPQFHPIPENDEWWGKGFTEWTNVTKATPLFKGHYQPHLPADLGFYDLRLPESRHAQAEMARAYGIYGFCYYHYWFNGKRILNRPVDDILSSGEPNFPFMLCWANENWTRRWDGGDETVLLQQNYSEEDARRHIQFLMPIFADDRYIKVQGKPIFAFYRSTIIPNFERYLDIFREVALREGIELHLARVESFEQDGVQWMKGLDAAIEFQPFSSYLSKYSRDVLTPRYKRLLFQRIKNKLLQILIGDTHYKSKVKEYYSRLDYNEYVDFLLKNYSYPKEYVRYPGVCPSWDNTARRGEKAFLFKNGNPLKFKEWLAFHVENLQGKTQENGDYVFINAWNEWAEGNHLEPCQKWGLKYLEAVRNSLNNA